MESWLSTNIYAELRVICELLLATLLGGIIGWDRERSGKPAGLRTHMVVCVASALFISLSKLWIDDLGDQTGEGIIRYDPTRVIMAIVTGISFVGAGSIIRRSSSDTHVEGLTTAAILLLSSAIGIAIAIHKYTLAIGTVCINLFITQGIHAMRIYWK